MRAQLQKFLHLPVPAPILYFSLAAFGYVVYCGSDEYIKLLMSLVD